MSSGSQGRPANPGPVVLFGSGETAPAGRAVFDAVMRQLPKEPRLALLETPAGFELNSARVIGRVADFLRHSLQNYNPQVRVVNARKRGTLYSPDDPQIAAPLLVADLVFMGPGSPSYAVRQLRGSLAWHYILARHQLGATLVLASAATVAVGVHALPVYEIYKVGEDLHWKAGLDLFGTYGLPLVFIPHWNNNDGGKELDTSRCFMGLPRFTRMMELLPADLTVLGIDEHTALVVDLQAGVGRVSGKGGVTVIHTGHRHRSPGAGLQDAGLADAAKARRGHVHRFLPGEAFPLDEPRPFEALAAGAGLPPEVWKVAQEAGARLEASRLEKETPGELEIPPQEALDLAAERQAARARQDWPAADALRAQIEALGWQVQDTPEGPRLARRDG